MAIPPFPTYTLPGIAVVPWAVTSSRPPLRQGIPMRDKGFFTYAQAHHGLELKYTSTLDTGYVAYAPKKERKNSWDRRKIGETENKSVALAFEPNFFNQNLDNVVASIAGLPFMSGLFEHGFMVTKYNLHTPGHMVEPVLIAGNDFQMLPPKFGQLSGHLFFFWEQKSLLHSAHTTFNEILSSCVSIERVIGDCEKCTENVVKCSANLLEIWIRKQKDAKRILNILIQDSTADSMTADDLGEFFEEYGCCDIWDYVSPGTTVGVPFSPNLRPVSEHTMWKLDALRKERKETAAKAVDTKNALKRCHDECVLFPTCSQLTYKSNARRCQAKQNGPLTVGQVKTVITQLLMRAKKEWLPRKQISLIAANSGVQTNLFSQRFQLVGLQKDMRHVKFRSVQRPEVEKTLTFENTMRLCRLPFWSGKDYENTDFDTDSVCALTDTELLLYYEICQRERLKKYHNMFGGSCVPIIVDIDWHPGEAKENIWERNIYGDVFGVRGHIGWTVHLSDITDIETIFGEKPTIADLS